MNEDISVKLSLDISSVKTQINTIKKEIKTLGSTSTTFKFNTTKATQDINKLKTQIKSLSTSNSVVKLNTTKATQDIKNLKNNLNNIKTPKTSIALNTTKAKSDINEITRKVENVSKRVYTTKIEFQGKEQWMRNVEQIQRVTDKYGNVVLVTNVKSNKINTGASAEVSDVKKLDTSLKSMFSGIKTGSATAKSNIGGITSSMNSLKNSASSVSRIFKFFTYTYLGRELARIGSTVITLGSNMSEIENLFNVSFGNMADDAEDFANSLQNAWGVSATLTKQQTAYLNNMMKSMGMTEQQAYGISTSMVQLSHNIASLYDISQTDAYEKLRSGLIGMSRPLAELGINTKVAELQQVAFERGITSSNRELSAQEKILAFNWAVWEQTKSAWASGTAIVNGTEVAVGDMTKTLGSNANMMRLISNQMGEIGRMWGLAFQPIAAYVLPLIYTLTRWLANLGRTFAVFIGRLVGIEAEAPDIAGGYETEADRLKAEEDAILDGIIGNFGSTDVDGSGLTDDMISGLEDTEDQAEDTKKALDNLTGGIDELNILQEPEDTSDSGYDTSLGGIENDIGLPNYDTIFEGAVDEIIAERMDDIRKAIDFMKESIVSWYKENETLVKGIVALGAALVGLSVGIGVFKGLLAIAQGSAALGGIFATLGNFVLSVKAWGLGSTLSALSTAILGVSGSTLALIGAIAALVAIFVAGFIYLYTTSEEFRTTINKAMSEVVEQFRIAGDIIYNEFILPVSNAIMGFIQTIWNNGLALLIENISLFVLKVIELIGVLLNFFLLFVLPILTAFIKEILEFAEPIIVEVMRVVNFIMLALNGFIDFLTGIFTVNWQLVWEDIVDMFESIFGAIGKLAQSIFNGVISIVNGFLNAIERGVNSVIDLINGLIDMWNNSLGDMLDWAGISLSVTKVNKFDIPDIPQFASGGLVYGETMGIMGEYAGAHNNPEVIAPLSDLEAILGRTSNNNGISQEELRLMIEQNELLRQLLDKDTSVNIDGKELARSQRTSEKKLGYNLGVI